jgi:hypothetical protein
MHGLRLKLVMVALAVAAAIGGTGVIAAAGPPPACSFVTPSGNVTQPHPSRLCQSADLPVGRIDFKV